MSTKLLIPFVSAMLLGLALQAKADDVPNRLFVVNTGDESVSLVDLKAMKEIKRFYVGASPYGVVVSPDGKRVAIGVEGEGKVKFFDTGTFKQLAEVRIGDMHHDHIILTTDGKHILDANYYSDTVLGINFTTMKEEFRIEGCSAPHVVMTCPQFMYQLL